MRKRAVTGGRAKKGVYVRERDRWQKDPGRDFERNFPGFRAIMTFLYESSNKTLTGRRGKMAHRFSAYSTRRTDPS